MNMLFEIDDPNYQHHSAVKKKSAKKMKGKSVYLSTIQPVVVAKTSPEHDDPAPSTSVSQPQSAPQPDLAAQPNATVQASETPPAPAVPSEVPSTPAPQPSESPAPTTQPSVPVSPASPPKPKVTRAQSMISLLIMVVVSAVVLYCIPRMTLDSQIRSMLLIFFGLLFICTFIPLLIEVLRSIIMLLKFLIAKPILLVIVGAVVFVSGIVCWQVLKTQQYRLNVKNVTLTQELLSQGMFIKTIGDDIQSGRIVPEGWDMTKVGSEMDLLLENLSSVASPRIFKDLYLSQRAWELSIYDGATGVQPWSTITPEPTPFEIALTDAQAVQALSDSIDRIAVLKEFGDNAIASGDTYAMRYIAAKAQAEYYFLSDVGNASEPSFFSFAPSAVSAAGTASFRRTICVPKNGKIICINNACSVAYKAYTSAHNYSVGEPTASQQWTTDWADAPASDLLDASGMPTGGVGLTTGESTQPTYSPTVQEFFDACRVKGGTTAVSTSVKTRLPTSESGYTCEYGSGGGCWDFLTYSGGRHMGGNPGCPEYNLVPVYPGGLVGNVVGPIKEGFVSIPDIVTDDGTNDGGTSGDTSSWDGTYSVTMTGGGCNMPGLMYYAFSPYSEGVTVQNNTIVAAGGGQNVPIDTLGNASTSFSFSESSYGGTYADSWTFTHTGSGTSVGGSFQFTGSGVEDVGGYVVNASVSCWGTYSGERVSY
jgi:hypothetical protein